MTDARGGTAAQRKALLLPGLNLHPDKLAPWGHLLATHGIAPVAPALQGYARPGDPAAQTVRPAGWLADLDTAWGRAQEASGTGAATPDAAPGLCAFSLGALLGLVWAAQRSLPLRWAVLIAPALCLRRRHRLLIAGLGRLLPDRLWVPSLAPAEYRMHRGTTVAAYRALLALEAMLRPTLAGWLAGPRDGGAELPAAAMPPPLFIAVSPRDEMVDVAALEALAAAWPRRVTLHRLAHRPRPGFPVHLGLDAATLGTAEWQRLTAAVEAWLDAVAAPGARQGPPTAPPDPAADPGRPTA